MQLLLGGVSTPAPQAMLTAESSQLPGKACDGYVMQPALLQSTFWQADAGCSIPAAVDSVLVQAVGTKINIAVCNSNSNSARLSADCGLAMCVAETVYYKPLQQVHTTSSAAAVPDIGDAIYSLEWRAESMLQPRQLMEVVDQLRHGGRAKASHLQRGLDLSQAACTAGAYLLVTLQQHRDRLKQNTISLLSTDGADALVSLGRQVQSIKAAAISGILKNLPYELPFLKAGMLDVEASGLTGSQDPTISSTALPPQWAADLYGVAARRGTLSRQLLVYNSRAGGDVSKETTLTPDATYLVTGGLGGLGLLASGWMTGLGARSVVLLGRSGYAANPGDMRSLIESQALVAAVKCDASFSEDARSAVLHSHRLSRKYSGIIHAAGVQVRDNLSIMCVSWLLASMH